ESTTTYHLLKSNLGAGVLLYLSAACTRLLPPPELSLLPLLQTLTKVLFISTCHQYSWDIVNQLTSVDEDRINKPHRPIPAGRLRLAAAKWRWLISWTLSPAIIYTFLNTQALVIFLLSEVLIGIYYVYPRLDHWIFRNIFPALWTFFSFRLLDSIICETYPQLSAHPKIDIILSLWVLSTIHIQEFHDVDGDRKIGRRTLPVVCTGSGMRVLRWVTAALIIGGGLGVVGWGWVRFLKTFPADFRGVGLVLTGVFHLFGAVVVGVRCVKRTSPDGDERTYKVFYILTAYWLVYFLSL
ncbi:UbiA family prenyltransferase, partial [Aspergillus ibericus CBS 121593]